MKNLVIAFLMVIAISAMPAYAFTREILNVLLRPHVAASPSVKSVNGGGGCAACTLAMAIVSQTMQAKNLEPAAAYATVCGYFPKALADICTLAVDIIGPSTYTMLSSGETPDAICNSLGSCTSEAGVCRLFPAKTSSAKDVHAKAGFKVQHPVNKFQHFNICTIIPGVCEVENHLPFSDTDGDRFSTSATLRGSDWRGKDCNDLDATAYPGRSSSDATSDQNCNGIYGVNPVTGLNYEDELCGNSGAMGVATLGDSASAHFRIPQDMMMAGVMNKDTFAKLLDFVEDEADWPMLSWSTGHANASDYSPSVVGPMISVYSRLNDLNKCNHRDFQNLGVNGARTSKLVEWVNLLARNSNTDKPILAFFAMVGNDVCNGRHNFDEMTTPQEYYTNVYNAIMAADAKFPKNSKIVLVPLVDGRILYDTMHDRIHPIGALNQDVTYSQFYDYLNCLETSPCWGWMNSNATVRNMTYAVASSLNAQLPIIANKVKGVLTNVQVTYAGDFFTAALAAYPGPKSDLIEPVDGFHPSQVANALLANFTVNTLQAAGVLPTTPNPNNAKIQALFGDQGGY